MNHMGQKAKHCHHSGSLSFLSSSQSLTSSVKATTIYTSTIIVSFELLLNENIYYIFFHICLLLLHIIVVRFIHLMPVAVVGWASLLCSIPLVDYITIYPSYYWTSRLFSFSCCESGAMNILVHMFWWNWWTIEYACIYL